MYTATPASTLHTGWYCRVPNNVRVFGYQIHHTLLVVEANYTWRFDFGKKTEVSEIIQVLVMDFNIPLPWCRIPPKLCVREREWDKRSKDPLVCTPKCRYSDKLPFRVGFDKPKYITLFHGGKKMLGACVF